MFSRQLALGASLVALSTGMASAQTTTSDTNRSTVNDSGVNNQVTVSNDTPGNDNNVSVITFEGRDNGATVAQVGDDNSSNSRHAGDANNSRVRQTGFRNTASLLQAGNRNSSNIDQHVDPRIDLYGDRIATVEQRGSDNSSTIAQLRWLNSATVVQGNAQEAGNGNISDILQFSAVNTARVTMLGGSVQAANRSSIEQTHIDPIVTRNSADVFIRGFGNGSNVFQQGQDNSASVTQDGSNNRSNSRTIGNGSRSAVRQVGNNNLVAVNQADGDRNSSNIDQFIDPGIGTYANREASVEQHGSDNSSTVRQVHWDNSATVVQGIAQPGRRLLSQGNTSQIIQFSAENVARVFMFEGSVQAPNRSFIEQTRIDPVVTRSLADVSIRGFGNRSEVSQTGGLHVAEVSILGGGVGLNRSLGRDNGNFSFIRQYGDLGHVARVSVGGLVSTPAVANEVFIEQQGSHPTVQASARVWQQGQGDRLRIRQTLLGGEEGGGWADTSQRGSLNEIILAQFGRHFATLTQGLGGVSSINLAQLDSSGGITRETRVTPPPYRGNNSFLAAQYGSRNEVSAWQEGSDNRATVWQKVGTNLNRIDLKQGRRSTSVEGASQCQAGCQFVSGASATITQGGGFNSARVNQYGSNHVATVEQFGTGDSGFSHGLVVITQTGTIGNRANVLQTATAGTSAFGDPPSGNSAAQNQQATGDPNATADAYYFAGGRRHAEARIYQTGGNSTATIEQRGRGQFALIDQSGSNNEASILQDVAATNATAVIQQDGNGNSYSVTQSEAGQYIHVRQSGSNNSVTSIIRRGPGS